MSIWTLAEIEPVFYQMGKIADDQRPAFVRAPFNIVKFKQSSTGSIDTYISTEGTEMEYGDLIGSDVAAEQEFQSRNGFGYITGVFVIEQHNMGDFNKDDMFGVHAFGII